MNTFFRSRRLRATQDTRAISLAECRRGPFDVRSDKTARHAIETIAAARVGDNAALLRLHQAAVHELDRCGNADDVRAAIEAYRLAVVASREKGAA